MKNITQRLKFFPVSVVVTWLLAHKRRLGAWQAAIVVAVIVVVLVVVLLVAVVIVVVAGSSLT